MVVLEVAQACMLGWRPPDDGDRSSCRYPESQGIYLEVYPKSRGLSSCRCFSICHCRRKRTSSDEHNCVNTTSLVPEERKMVWRKYNEDNFLVALFTLGDDDSSFRTGDQLELVADIFRQPLDTEQKGDKIMTMIGSFWVGFWGPVCLTEEGVPILEDVDEEHLLAPNLRLDLRPMSLRPFTLEFARPAQVYEDVETLWLRALMNKIKQPERQAGIDRPRRFSTGLIQGLTAGSMIQWPKPYGSSTGEDGSRPIIKSRNSKGMFESAPSAGSDFTGKRLSHGQFACDVSFQEHWTPAYSWGASQGLEEQKSTSSSMSLQQLAQHVGKGRRHSFSKAFGIAPSITSIKSSQSSRSAQSQLSSMLAKADLQSSPNPKWQYGGTIFAESETILSTLTAGLEGEEGFVHAYSSSMATIGSQWRPFFRPFSDHAQQQQKPDIVKGTDYAGVRNEWVPSDWSNVWKSQWPSKGDDLGSKVEVVPLMETEFRRDCIAIFNTLFPMIAGERFSLMRDLAFHPSSKIRFKPVTKNRPSMLSMLSHLSEEGAEHEGDEEPRWVSSASLSSVGSPTDFGGDWCFRNSVDPVQRDFARSQEKGFWRTCHAAAYRARMCMKHLARGSEVDRSSLGSFTTATSSAVSVTSEGSVLSVETLEPAIFAESALWMTASEAIDDIVGQLSKEKVVHDIEALSAGSSAAPTDISVAHESDSPDRGFDKIKLDTGFICAPSPKIIPGFESAVVDSFHRSRRCYFPPVMRCNGDLAPVDWASDGEDATSTNLGQRRSRQEIQWCRQTSRGVDADRNLELNFDLSSTVSSSSRTSSREVSPLGSAFCTKYSRPDSRHTASNDLSTATGSNKCLYFSDKSVNSPEVASPNNGTASFWMDAFGFRSDKEGFKSDKENMPKQRLPRIISTEFGDFHDDYSQRILFLKRLLVCYAYCGVFYTEAANSEQLGEVWPYPIAAIFGHGSRVLIRLEDVEATEFLNFLLTGDPHYFDWREGGVPAPLKPRIAATHSAILECETGNVVEKKLKVNASDTVQNLADGIRKKHLGLNIPIGGVGNPSPLGKNCYIDYHGRVVREAKKTQAMAMVKLASSKINMAVGKVTPGMLNRVDRNRSSEDGKDDAEACPELLRNSSASSLSSRGMDSTCSTSGLGSYRQLPNVQSGHLYIRIDDFGEHAGSWAGFQGDSRSSRTEEMRRFLRRKPNKTSLALQQAEQLMQVYQKANQAGEVFFRSSVPRIKIPRETASLGLSGHRMSRMNSMPNLQHESGTTSDDVRWANQWIMFAPGGKLPMKPPSTGALQMLLEYYDPISVQLYGKSHFKTMQEFWYELCHLESFLVKRGYGVQRCLESVVLELCWQGHVLMNVAEEKDPVTKAQKRHLPRTKLRPYEHWQKVTTCLAVGELDLPEDSFLESLVARDDRTHRIVEETLLSSSFPGVFNLCRTHIVRWEISDTWTAWYRSRGMLVDPDRRATNPHQADFKVCKHDERICYWQWAPQKEVGHHKAQNYNLGQTKVDDSWVKYAIHKDGIVQYPPTEAALTVLLRRTGVDISKFGKHPHKTLHDLWVELLNQASYLQMDKGKPTRVLEGTLVRIRMEKEKGVCHVLVKSQANVEDNQHKSLKKLMRTSKKKEETWEDAAIRCVLEEFNVSKSKFKGLCITSSNPCHYRYFEEFRESRHVPGLLTMYRLHLVTYTVCEDILRLPEVRKCLRMDSTTSILSSTSEALPQEGNSPKNQGRKTGPWSMTWSADSTGSSDTLVSQIDVEGPSSTSSATPAGWMKLRSSKEKPTSPQHFKSRSEFTWMEETDAEKAVADLSYWARSQKKEETHHISCVLIGLEGAAPNCKGPFGSMHDAKGTSAKVSALGNRKWRAYRLNNAFQIPSTEGGMRMKINKEMFQELIEACDDVCLLDPSLDLTLKPSEGYPRSFLDQRHAEKEFFKEILGSSGRQARNAVDWMRKFCSVHRLPDQVYSSMHRQRRRNDTIYRF